MKMSFKLYDNWNQCWYQPIYRAYDNIIEEIFVNQNGDLIMRNQDGLTHESMFKDRFTIHWEKQKKKSK